MVYSGILQDSANFLLAILGFFGSLFTSIWFWIIAGIAFFSIMTYLNMRKSKLVGSTDNVLLMLEIPRENDKKELSAEQMFASLHGILRSKKELNKEGKLQDQISFEFASIGQQIKFYIYCPAHLQNFVEGQVYAQYPTVQIKNVDEPYTSSDMTNKIVYASEVALQDNDVLPIKTFPSFEVDPLAGVTATLAKLEEHEDMWVQIIARPVDDVWHKKSIKYVEKLKKSGGKSGGSAASGYLASTVGALTTVPDEAAAKKAAGDLGERDKSRVTAIEEKSKKLGYQVKMRVVYIGQDKETARLRMQAMIGTFKQFNSTNLNGFKEIPIKNDSEALEQYKARYFTDKGYILNIEELASVYHLPHTTVETPSIVWATSKTSEPPSNLPAHGSVDSNTMSLLGMTNFRGSNVQFGIKRRDRSRHMYVIGQTGTGKSFLLQLLTLADIHHNEGFAIIDPHGDYALSMLKYIPEHRLKDVVFFNPADTEFPVAFNPMEVIDPSLKNHISSDIVGVLKRMFEHSWGPRLEYILRYTILALLDTPNTTMLDITRMLTEKHFRQKVIDNVEDTVVRNFWVTEFASWNEKFATEAVAPILNKVGAFTANPIIRNMIGQPTSSFNIREIMDEGKILVVNLSRGLIGEDNASIMGALLVTKVQLAAMSRADIVNIDDRKPFYLYVDEFQNFATDSFAVILSEARKYALNLTVANQYTSQMTDEVRDAVFGNVGSIVSLRVGAEDAAGLSKYFDPQFEPQDLIQLHNMNWVTSMTIDGEKGIPFSATSLRMPEPTFDYTPQIVELSREGYSRPKADVVAEITKNTTPDPREAMFKGGSSKNGKKGGKKSPQANSSTTPEIKSEPLKTHGNIRQDETISLR